MDFNQQTPVYRLVMWVLHLVWGGGLEIVLKYDNLIEEFF